MLGRCAPQTSIFDGDQQYLEHVGERNLYGFLARHRHELFHDEDFAALYSSDNGRPSVPPSLLCTALVLQTYERCSDAEARDRAAFDLRWKVALGVADRDRPYAKSTLQLFRAQLLVHDKLRLPFERSLQLARRTGHMKSDGKLRAAVDTTNVLGRGAVKDTYNLLADGILSVMRVLAKAAGTPLEQWAVSHELTRYLAASIKGEAAIDWNDRRAREALLGELVVDAERMLELGRCARAGWAAGGPDDERLVRATDVLRQVLLQDIERDQSGGTRLRHGTSADRICSVHDSEMRHGRKSSSTRWDGHKLAVAADVESQVITAIEVLPGSAKDQEGSLELAQQAAANTGLEVEAVLGDCAYGGGANRERFAEAGIELLAKVPASRPGEHFPKEAFTIDPVAMTCRCPAGQVTTHLVGVRDLRFQFSRAVCRACPLRTDCYAPNPKGRSILVHPQEALLQRAQAWQHSPSFALFRKQRQVVEHRIARLVQLGIRQARYFGRVKTRFQAFMAATVANLTLIGGLMAGGTRHRGPFAGWLWLLPLPPGPLTGADRPPTSMARSLRPAPTTRLALAAGLGLALSSPGFRPDL